jgi:hypothetical protein
MKLLARRPSLAPLVLFVVLALVVGLTLALRVGSAPAKAQEVGPSDRAAVIGAFFGALNSGDAEGAAALFATSAVLIGSNPNGNCKQVAPCTDSAGIHQYATGAVSAHQCRVLRTISVAGAVVTGQFEQRGDAPRSLGIGQFVDDFIALVPAGQITFYAALDDPADPQTALLLASTPAQPAGPPIPTPATPCARAS